TPTADAARVDLVRNPLIDYLESSLRLQGSCIRLLRSTHLDDGAVTVGDRLALMQDDASRRAGDERKRRPLENLLFEIRRLDDDRDRAGRAGRRRGVAAQSAAQDIHHGWCQVR